MDDDRKETIDINRYRIKPLKSESYYVWAWKMKLILKGKGLWQIVTGVEREPEAISEKRKFLLRKDLALKMILLAISESCCAPVVNIEDPKNAWEKLQKTYESMSKAHMDAFVTQLQAIKMNATEKIMDFVNRIKTLENKLAAVGYTVDADEKRRILLRGVREEYSIPVQVIRSSGLEVDKAISDLIVSEADAEIRDGRDFEDGGPSALSMNHRNGCQFCGTPIPNGILMHTTQDCFHNPNGRKFKPHLA